jgi:hypothetical protein
VPPTKGRPERDSLEFDVSSGEVEELLREAWFRSIPMQFRAREGGESRNGSNRHLSSALILPPPPKPILDRFFQRFERHLTQDQPRARNKFVSNRVERVPAAPPPSKRKRAKPSLTSPSELPATASN